MSFEKVLCVLEMYEDCEILEIFFGFNQKLTRS